MLDIIVFMNKKIYYGNTILGEKQMGFILGLILGTNFGLILFGILNASKN